MSTFSVAVVLLDLETIATHAKGGWSIQCTEAQLCCTVSSLLFFLQKGHSVVPFVDPDLTLEDTKLVTDWMVYGFPWKADTVIWSED
jgi:hypothetical protein